jgi:hypothetical protein
MLIRTEIIVDEQFSCLHACFTQSQQQPTQNYYYQLSYNLLSNYQNVPSLQSERKPFLLQSPPADFNQTKRLYIYFK